MSTRTKVNALIAACALSFLMVLGLVWERPDVRTTSSEQQEKSAAVQPGIPEGATNGSSAFPSLTSGQIAAPAADSVASTGAPPVVIAVVKPWIEIARMPQYVQASSDGREAIRDLYWRTCVEERIPPEQRTSAYELFARGWAIRESSGSEATTRTTSPSQRLREQQVAVSSPVNAETMRRWCGR